MTLKINAAIDCGAGTTKIRIGSRRSSQTVSMPSLISIVPKKSVLEGAIDVFNVACFSLVEGETETFFFAGDTVREMQLPSEDVFADPTLKVNNARKLVLAALVEGLNLSKDQSLEVKAVASHHDPVNFDREIREALTGEHVMRKGNNTFTITISMPKLGVFAEGSAIGEVFGEETPKHFGVLDLGFLTALYSLKGQGGATLNDEKVDYGVGRLVEMLQASSDFRKLLGGIQPDRDVLIGSIIEACQSKSQKLFYRSRGKAIDYTSPYKATVPQWLKGAAKAAIVQLNERKGTDFKVVAIGGGVNLPMVATTLKKVGIISYTDARGEDACDPIFANCETLYARHRNSLFQFEPELKIVLPSDASFQDDLEVVTNG